MLHIIRNTKLTTYSTTLHQSHFTKSKTRDLLHVKRDMHIIVYNHINLFIFMRQAQYVAKTYIRTKYLSVNQCNVQQKQNNTLKLINNKEKPKNTFI